MAMNGMNDHLYKIILIGNMNVGKTCLLTQYVQNQLPKNTAPTIGVEFATKNVTLKTGVVVKAQIWDTAGQERYKAICGAHYKRAKGALLVYDVTSRETFDELESWIENLMSKAEEEIQVILVGNKIDKVRQNPASRQVDIEEAQQLAERNNFMFIETSAFASENVTSAFETLLNAISDVQQKMQSQGKNNLEQSRQCLRLHDPELEEKEAGCCY